MLCRPLLSLVLCASALTCTSHLALATVGGSCDMPGGVLEAGCLCDATAGDTSDTLSDWYEVELEAGRSHALTLCSSTCPDANASFDSRLELYGPGDCMAPVATGDDECGLQSEIVYTPVVDGPHVLRVTGFSDFSNGPYSVAVVFAERTGASCDDAAPLPDPLTTCQVRGDELCGDEYWYTIDLYGNAQHTFTLCDATCTGTGADFDALLELYDADDNLVASDTATCGDLPEIVYDVPAADDGQHCLRVVREGGMGESFDIGWFVECSPPSNIEITPTDGTTVRSDCGINQTFTATTLGIPPFTFEWEVEPLDPSDTADPDTFTEMTDESTSMFTTTLTGAGDYLVSVRVINDCGEELQQVTYTLSDGTGPSMECTAVPCEDVGPDFAPTQGPPGAGFERSGAGPGLAAHAAPTGDDAPEHSAIATFHAPRHADRSDLRERLLAEATTELERDRLGRKVDTFADSAIVFDGRDPDLASPPGALAVSCGVPCTSGTIEALHPFYDVFLDCNNGAFTARTGPAHSVTIGSGAMQNVIFGGSDGNPVTSDITFFVHDNDTQYLDPAGGEAYVFDPIDTSDEPDSIGLEAEWERTPFPGANLTLREEIVAFGDIEENSGIRLTLEVTNQASSSEPVTVGVRWQIDYQNATDDGPLYASVTCSPFSVGPERSTEREFPPDEIDDFYRIRNNAGSPVFSNFTSTTEVAGFPDTGLPDRLAYGRWPSFNASDWDVAVMDGANADIDSATIYYYGYLEADGLVVLPGQTVRRSVIIFTAAEEESCAGFETDITNAETEVCPGECVQIGATAEDQCSDDVTITLIDSTPGAPPCVGNPCDVVFPDEGEFVYTWQAEDEQGNTTECTSTVLVVRDPDECGAPPTCDPGPPQTSSCREAVIDAATITDPDGDTVSYEWTSDRADVTITPATGSVDADFDGELVPETMVTLDPGTDPCGVVATLTLSLDDGAGFLGSCTVEVTFDDTEAPVPLAMLIPMPPEPPMSALEPLSALAPASACSAPTSGTFLVRCEATDACDEMPALLAELLVTRAAVDPTTGECTDAVEAVDVECGELVLLNLEDPCPARPPSSSTAPSSVPPILTISGSSITLQVTAADSCGNTATAEFNPATSPAPDCESARDAGLCDSPMPPPECALLQEDGTCCPALAPPP